MERNHRFFQLDSLRGIAAFVVMLHHYFAIYDRDFKHNFFVPPVFMYGFYGVELFFIISGFVIYYTLHYCRTAGDFLIKRFIRLFPTYWLCVCITFLAITCFPLSAFRDTTWKDALVNMTMLNGLVGVKGVDPSYWSLQPELFFYLLMTFLFFTRLSKYLYTCLWVWLGLILFYNLVHKIPVAGAFLNLKYGSLFIAGICFYKIKVEKDLSLQALFLLIASYVCTLVVLRDLEGVYGSITIVYLLFICALFCKMKIFSWKALIFLGNISYALYLIHQNIGFIIIRQTILWTGISGPEVVILPIIISILLAWLITYYFEKEVISRLKRLLLTNKTKGASEKWAY
ncbi:MAG: acyltransferase [Filimonas sp.]|nr:acyltransferase [Filimonas sp.]